jgi:hypothetical protein
MHLYASEGPNFAASMTVLVRHAEHAGVTTTP